VATKLFVHGGLSQAFSTGNNDPNLRGTATAAWTNRTMTTTAGTGLTLSQTTATVAGATAGVEVNDATTLNPFAWYSDPLAADVTISGVITVNIWAIESSNSANVAINARIEKVDGANGNVITVIATTARTTELGTASRTLQSFTVTPAAGVLCKKGDRLRVRIFGDDAGTMGSGFTFHISYDGPTAAADGDTWIQTTENLTFITATPTGTQIFPTDTASDVSTASVDREAWTSRGAGVQTDVTNTVAGWTAPIQVTDTAGGTVVDWFTRPLQAVTLGGAVRCNIRALESASAANVSLRCEIAVVAGDGSGAVAWAAGNTTSEIATVEVAFTSTIYGADVAISSGQRLRIRILIDDVVDVAMGASQTATLFYAGTSASASGDTWLTFTQTLTEFVAPPGPHVSPYPQILAH
jgi:hypothetical protein